MAARPKLVEGQYNIECSVCGCEMKSGEMILGRETREPMHAYHAEENHERFPVIPPVQKVPDPQTAPEDEFTTYDVSHTPEALTYE